MKYIIIDSIKNGDVFTKEFETAEEAIEAAEYEWRYLGKNDKKRRAEFYVLESVNPDEDAENHLDGNEVKRWI